MKAITLWQPWALLLVCGAKIYETRSWATSHRGEIAIHAALKDPHSIMMSLPHGTSKAMYDCMYEKLGIESGALRKMRTGCIIATAELVDCWEMHGAHSRGSSSKDIFIDKFDANDPNGITWIDGNEMLFGDWTPGRYAWEFKNMKMLDKPIPTKGAQRVWNWEE